MLTECEVLAETERSGLDKFSWQCWAWCRPKGYGDWGWHQHHDTHTSMHTCGHPCRVCMLMPLNCRPGPVPGGYAECCSDTQSLRQSWYRTHIIAAYLQDLLALPDIPTCYKTSPFCATVCESHLYICKSSSTIQLPPALWVDGA